MFRCPKCRHPSLVLDNRPSRYSVRRRRKCAKEKCGHRWTTYEIDGETGAMFESFEKLAHDTKRRLRTLESELVHTNTFLQQMVRAIRNRTPGKIMRGDRSWTAQEKNLLVELYSVHGAAVCAERLNRSVAAVRKQARTIGLVAPQRGKKRETVNASNGKEEHTTLA
jgi:hypothetical protein